MNPITIDPEVMHGTPCVAGTRVPVQNLFDVLAGGEPIGEFLEGFPTVRRDQVVAVLTLATSAVCTQAAVISAGAA